MDSLLSVNIARINTHTWTHVHKSAYAFLHDPVCNFTHSYIFKHFHTYFYTENTMLCIIWLSVHQLFFKKKAKYSLQKECCHELLLARKSTCCFKDSKANRGTMRMAETFFFFWLSLHVHQTGEPASKSSISSRSLSECIITYWTW